MVLGKMELGSMVGITRELGIKVLGKMEDGLVENG